MYSISILCGKIGGVLHQVGFYNNSIFIQYNFMYVEQYYYIHIVVVIISKANRRKKMEHFPMRRGCLVGGFGYIGLA